MPRRLQARVRRVTGETRNFVARLEGGELVREQEIRPPTWVYIEPVEAGFLLHHMDDTDDRSLADSWHESIEGAKRQAQFEFDITEADWQWVEV
jgi:hypothetical protein